MPLKKIKLTFIERVRKEHEEFIAKVKSLPADEIINNALEIAVKNEIYECLETADVMQCVTEAQKNRLCKFSNIIDEIYNKWFSDWSLSEKVTDFVLGTILK